ncbi:hypothetical protein KIH39_22405 [Telmatocola sphagniphila]|uniref:Cytochrome c-552/4 domain-containing protein n=1 Tax=Telmatocola sphagniphila TaxID=1123043 RepID=A0A8E6EXF3_9BACT|nr:multiheme c-type cytochrome [Telmatocola sphagniphila]QVL31568.1 hypothetical protein KIH39_22405 [Telmatocola sphagniphila]
MLLRPTVSGLLIASLLIGVYFLIPSGLRAISSTPSPAGETTPISSKIHGAPTLFGSAGCSGSNCHSQSPADSQESPQSLWKSSQTIWTLKDPHAQSYETLLNAKSQAMMKRLYPNENHSAQQDLRCLACHANPLLVKTLESKTFTDEQVALLREGVSCEACHGAANAYRSEHVSWTDQTDREKAYSQFGLTRLYDWNVRAAQCAGCHVGAPASKDQPLRDVNHDFIAAGHPRLNFEFATYLRALPRHWSEKDRLQGNRPLPVGWEAVAWSAGATERAKAALGLLADRVERKPWPELAEFNCFSCHHDLKVAGWRPSSSGRLVWNTLFVPGHDFPGIQKTLQQGDTALLTREIAQALFLLKQPVKPLTVDALLQRLTQSQPLDWDTACQIYYALLVLKETQSLNDADKVALLNLLDQIQKILKLPRGPEVYNSPREYDPSPLPSLFGQALSLLKKGG